MNSALASLWIIVILAAPSAAQNAEPAPPVPGVRSADRMPGDLCGQAAVFPIGRKDNDLKAVLYVSSYYNAARRWPVLIDGNARGRLGRSLQTFRVEAEKHGFILLSVEYLYHTGREEDTHKVWTREGDGAIKEHSRTLPEFLSDMAVDEQVLHKLIITPGEIGRALIGTSSIAPASCDTVSATRDAAPGVYKMGATAALLKPPALSGGAVAFLNA